jgi:hypothetical protein
MLRKLYEREHGVWKDPSKATAKEPAKPAPAPESKNGADKRTNKYFDDAYEQDFLDDIPTLKDAPKDGAFDFDDKKRHDIFDTSKDKIKQEPATKKEDPTHGAAEMESEEEYEVSRKAVEDKFK